MAALDKIPLSRLQTYFSPLKWCPTRFFLRFIVVGRFLWRLSFRTNHFLIMINTLEVESGARISLIKIFGTIHKERSHKIAKIWPPHSLSALAQPSFLLIRADTPSIANIVKRFAPESADVRIWRRSPPPDCGSLYEQTSSHKYNHIIWNQ